ncbi:hypothetical protein [Turicibacter sanguinis]|uniref:hypothetical protein n=2 Tax=Turicibacter sanguinis TaxID=154288 RepID=UPI00241FC580|nr:hypothetical protein [Turicibacter sanguinis]
MQNIADAMFIFIGMLLFIFLATIGAMGLNLLMNKFPKLKKVLYKIMDIQVCELSMSQRQAIANYINHQIMNFMAEWSNGDSNTFKIYLSELNLDEYDEGVEEEIAIIEDLLLDEVESWDVVDDDLYIEVNSYVLEQRFNRQMAQWEREGQLERAEYHRSRGVI